jgi:hypothetical protein
VEQPIQLDQLGAAKKRANPEGQVGPGHGRRELRDEEPSRPAAYQAVRRFIEAPSSQRVRLGLVLKGRAADERLRAVGGTCNQAVDMTDVELIDWLRNGYQAAA